MTKIIHDTVIVTGDDNDTVLYGASIAIDGTKIAAIGPNAELEQRYPGAERIDGHGKMVMPGFANVHTHLTMTLARGVFEDLSPSHKPPFSGGLSPIPLPKVTPDEPRPPPRGRPVAPVSSRCPAGPRRAPPSRLRRPGGGPSPSARPQGSRGVA